MEYADLDLYAKNVLTGDVCYFAETSIGGFMLQDDAHPACETTPESPEVITGSFNESGQFQFWWNQYSECAAAVDPDADVSATVQITNTGTGNLEINVDGTSSGGVITLAPGESHTIDPIQFTGSYGNLEEPGYENGTDVVITCVASSSSTGGSCVPESGGYCRYQWDTAEQLWVLIATNCTTCPDTPQHRPVDQPPELSAEYSPFPCVDEDCCGITVEGGVFSCDEFGDPS